jgi:hypothetical protein
VRTSPVSGQGPHATTASTLRPAIVAQILDVCSDADVYKRSVHVAPTDRGLTRIGFVVDRSVARADILPARLRGSMRVLDSRGV